MQGMKITNAVTSMRQMVYETLLALSQGDVSTERYAGISCETCIHQLCHAKADPCRDCTSVTRKDRRDYRTTAQCRWTPNFDAHPNAIKRFHRRFSMNALEFYLRFPPLRCINPGCHQGFPQAYDRGLCKECYSKAHKLVRRDADAADNALLMMLSGDDPFDYEAARAEFFSLHTWQRLVLEGKALPTEEDFTNEKQSLPGLRHYYQLAKVLGRDPTFTELCDRAGEHAATKLSGYVSFSEA
jgi:hypothetical protein